VVGGEPDPPRQLNRQQQPAQLGPSCTDRRWSRRGWRRSPRTREGLGTKTGPRKSSTEALHKRPGWLDIDRPGFLYSFGPLSPRGQWTRAGHQVEPGDECCLDSKESVVPTESPSIREVRTDGVGGLQHMECGGRRRPCMLFKNSLGPLMPGRRTARYGAINWERGEDHTLGRQVTFSSSSPRRNCTWQRWRVANVCREDHPFQVFLGSRIGTRPHPDGVTKHGISGQWPPRTPGVPGLHVLWGLGKSRSPSTDTQAPGEAVSQCTCPSGFTAGPDPIYSSGRGGGGQQCW